MKKNQMNLLIAKPLTAKEKKGIMGGAARLLSYYCTVSTSTSCVVYASKAACVASGCPSNKCTTFSICIDPE